MPLIITFAALLLIVSLTIATHTPQNGFPRVRRQNLVNQPSWTHPDFCSETGQIADVASLMVHPPGTKTLDYSSLCSEVLRPTVTPGVTSTLTGDSVIIVTSTATTSISTTNTDTSRSTITALCAVPTPLQHCSIPALGYAQNILYYRTNIDAVFCHKLCLQDAKCKSFQVVPQDNGYFKFLRCNIYSTNVNGHVSETGDGEAVFWDRGCQDLLSAGCTKKSVPQDGAALDEYKIQKRELPSHLKTRSSKDKQCCKIQWIKDFQHDDGESSPDSLLGEETQDIKIERQELQPVPDWDNLSEGLLPTDEAVKIERRDSPRFLAVGSGEGWLSLVDEQDIRIERREVNGYKLPVGAGNDGYKLPISEGKDAPDGQNIRIEKRRGYVPSRSARTAAAQARPRGKNGYKLPLAEGEEDIPNLPSPTENGRFSQLEEQNIRIERRNDSPPDPLITLAPTLHPQIETEVELEVEGQDIRIQRREYTTPDLLATYFPLFVTFACSCLVTSAAPEVTRTVTEVVQTWSYTTTTSTKSEVYRYTEHPSWSTVYRTVG